MSFSPIVWRYDESSDPHYEITINLCRQRDGSVLYAVRQLGNCMDRDGEWEYEPIPSSRDDEFMARCRFATWEEAAGMVLSHAADGKGAIGS